MNKFMVVPYVKPIARASDSRVNDLDGEMTSVMANPNLSIEEKIRMYNQALSRFQTFFDPNTYGESATSLDMASTIRAIADEAVAAKQERKVKVEEDEKSKKAIVDAIKANPAQIEAHFNTIVAQKKKAKPDSETDTDAYESTADITPKKPRKLPPKSTTAATKKKTAPELPVNMADVHPSHLMAEPRRTGSKVHNIAGSGIWHSKKFFF
jgi:hypothetical protein